MHTRELLALSRLEEFAAWAIAEGFTREPAKGDYEVLRLRWPGQPPLIYFTRLSTHAGGDPVHATAQHEGSKLVKRWLRERKDVQRCPVK